MKWRAEEQSGLFEVKEKNKSKSIDDDLVITLKINLFKINDNRK